MRGYVVHKVEWSGTEVVVIGTDDVYLERKGRLARGG
jgi:hypothetical protein